MFNYANELNATHNGVKQPTTRLYTNRLTASVTFKHNPQLHVKSETDPNARIPKRKPTERKPFHILATRIFTRTFFHPLYRAAPIPRPIISNAHDTKTSHSAQGIPRKGNKKFHLDQTPGRCNIPHNPIQSYPQKRDHLITTYSHLMPNEKGEPGPSSYIQIVSNPRPNTTHTHTHPTPHPLSSLFSDEK